MKQRKLLSALISFCVGITYINAQTVMDADSNIYTSVTIGKQIWLAENLKTTKYNDGKVIPLVSADRVWKELETPAYCWFNNDISNKEDLGALYNWYAVNTKKLCPKGWHVPTKAEWVTMIIFLGDENTAGAKLKESGTEHWKNSIIISTNEFGFTALPGGLRMKVGTFPEFGTSYAVWWTATDYDQVAAWNRGLFFNSSNVYGGFDNKKNGFSVRCIHD